MVIFFVRNLFEFLVYWILTYVKFVVDNCSSVWSGDGFWEALDTVPRMPRVPSPRCSLYEVLWFLLLDVILMRIIFHSIPSMHANFYFLNSNVVFLPLFHSFTNALFWITVETVQYFIEERKHKKTWLKLNSIWNVGISNYAKRFCFFVL